jgi:hypothetical protein
MVDKKVQYEGKHKQNSSTILIIVKSLPNCLVGLVQLYLDFAMLRAVICYLLSIYLERGYGQCPCMS